MLLGFVYKKIIESKILMGHNISGKSQRSYYMEIVLNRYDAKVDNKKRISIRGSKYDYYSVTEYEDGKVVLEPRF